MMSAEDGGCYRICQVSTTLAAMGCLFGLLKRTTMGLMSDTYMIEVAVVLADKSSINSS
jgi:hypothetical protein